MIKAIIFDYGGVLGSDADEWETTFREIPQLTGLSPSKIQEVFEKHWPKLKLGKEPIKDFWVEITRLSKKEVDSEKLHQIYTGSVLINKDAINLVKKLKSEDFKLAILANESKEGINAKIKKFRLEELFDKIYCSAFLGMAKPRKEVFEYAIKDLNQKPEEMLFIDNQEPNILTARSLGIPAILFTTHKNLKEKLKKFTTGFKTRGYKLAKPSSSLAG